MFWYILVGLIVLLAVVALRVAKMPDSATYKRSAVIAAPPGRILPHLTDFRKWSAWSPWEQLDPAMKRTYSGTAEGVGARYTWEGNKKAGAGSMEIVEVTPDSVHIDLRFTKPWASVCDTVFRLAPEVGATRVSWTMAARQTFGSKLFGLFMNMDKLIGKDFEKGLASMKRLAQAG